MNEQIICESVEALIFVFIFLLAIIIVGEISMYIYKLYRVWHIKKIRSQKNNL